MELQAHIMKSQGSANATTAAAQASYTVNIEGGAANGRCRTQLSLAVSIATLVSILALVWTESLQFRDRAGTRAPGASINPAINPEFHARENGGHRAVPDYGIRRERSPTNPS
ncbi:TPA: hypothetical protein ACH3X2_011372 [Trebouxia sp. C0005]